MNRRPYFISMTFLIAIIFGLSIGLFVPGTPVQAEKEDSSLNIYDGDMIEIDNEDYRKDRKGPVKFSHRKHAQDYNVACWDCHHEYEDEINIYSPWGSEQKQCVECHTAVEDNETGIKLQRAFHLNCKTCHLTDVQENKGSTAPVKCLGCHERVAKK